MSLTAYVADLERSLPTRLLGGSMLRHVDIIRCETDVIKKQPASGNQQPAQSALPASQPASQSVSQTARQVVSLTAIFFINMGCPSERGRVPHKNHTIKGTTPEKTIGLASTNRCGVDTNYIYYKCSSELKF